MLKSRPLCSSSSLNPNDCDCYERLHEADVPLDIRVRRDRVGIVISVKSCVMIDIDIHIHCSTRNQTLRSEVYLLLSHACRRLMTIGTINH